MNNITKYLIVAAIAFLLGCLFTCNRKSDDIAGETTDTKIEVRERIVNHQQTLTDTIPVVEYKFITKDSLIHIPDPTSQASLINFTSKKLSYEYKKSLYSENNVVRNDLVINGWGGITNIESKFTISDTLRDTIKTTKITKIKAPNALFLGAGYMYHPDSKTALRTLNLDYSIKSKALIGIQGGLDNSNKAYIGARMSIKIH